MPDSVTNRYYHSLSVWTSIKTQLSVWMIVFGGLRPGSILSDTTFIESMCRGAFKGDRGKSV